MDQIASLREKLERDEHALAVAQRNLCDTQHEFCISLKIPYVPDLIKWRLEDRWKASHFQDVWERGEYTVCRSMDCEYEVLSVFLTANRIYATEFIRIGSRYSALQGIWTKLGSWSMDWDGRSKWPPKIRDRTLKVGEIAAHFAEFYRDNPEIRCYKAEGR